MDKGAHYHRTDLQVHTPRDRQWFGNGATLEEERRVYAAELVATARQAGLSAVAITDHHDMALVDYVRAAAETEIDAEGRPLPVEQRLAVFPGMELTLGVPCQALLIFDANFPTDLFSLVLNALAITPAPATESRTAETVRLDRITSLESLYEELDRHAYLKRSIHRASKCQRARKCNASPFGACGPLPINAVRRGLPGRNYRSTERRKYTNSEWPRPTIWREEFGIVSDFR